MCAMNRGVLGGVVFASAVVLVGSCGGGGWDWDIDLGYLTVRLADSAVDDALAVVVQVEAVDARVSGAHNPGYDYDRFKIQPVQQINLLALSDGRSELLLKGVVLSADRWDWMRLVIRAGINAEDSWVETATGRHALFLPESNERSLLVPTSFVVPKNGTVDLTIDFDLRQSIIPPQSPDGLYLLDPVLRLVETELAGQIDGTVDPLWIDNECTPVVYGFAGSNVAPDDIDRVAPEPVTEGTVRLDGQTGDYRYVLAWLPAGEYTVALTCQGDLDRPDRDDTPMVTFLKVAGATVAAGQSIRIDL
jgi:hypothetical protein